MKRHISFLFISILFAASRIYAQTAMPLSGLDCNGNYHNLFTDLDAGKAVLLHFYMDNCGSCPPPAQKIQAMANKVMTFHPGMITGYALPYNNTDDCSAVSAWVNTNGLNLFAPFDSGATQVAHYGGFGMPTVVLLGGTNHRVMFSTQSFVASDTTIMRDSILALLNDANAIKNLSSSNQKLHVYPNPCNNFLVLNIEASNSRKVIIELMNINGTIIRTYVDENVRSIYSKQLDVSDLNSGSYTVRITKENSVVSKRFTILH